MLYDDRISAFGKLLLQILTGECLSKINIGNLRVHMKNRKGKRMQESLRRELDPRLPDVDDATISKVFKLASVAFKCIDDPQYTLNSALDVLRRL